VGLRAGRDRKREQQQGSEREEATHNEERGKRGERLPREFIRTPEADSLQLSLKPHLVRAAFH
jgi:hypothetical protein